LVALAVAIVVQVRKVAVALADGRELIYYGDRPADPAAYPDLGELDRPNGKSELRFDPLGGEWVVVASHRQNRTYRPSDDHCPLCPSTGSSHTEIPAPSYDVVVFENRFPALTAGPAGQEPAGQGDSEPNELLTGRPASGRSEVICFSEQHDASFADLSAEQAAAVLWVWADRSRELARLPGIAQVICFENRGREIGATLSHPHGQIHAYPFVAPRTSRMVTAAVRWRERTGRNLFDDIVASEQAARTRIIAAGEYWVAFVPYASRWPYEAHLYPRERVPDLPALPEAAWTEFCELYLDLLGRFDRLFGMPAPYISAWHQAPVRESQGRREFALHLELFTLMRAPGKLKYLAGAESAMGTFSSDVEPEAAASRLRLLGAHAQ
jgi:UDPglucose--hexose-1-phosphate uridylyltransferase